METVTPNNLMPPAESGGQGVRLGELRELLGVWATLGARPRERKVAVNASDVVETVLKSLRLEDRLGEEELRGQWNACVGPFLAGETRPGELHRGVLTVMTRNPSVLFHLTPMKRSLLAKLQTEFGSNKIRDLVFRVG